MKKFKPALYAISLGALLAFNMQCGGLSKKKILDVENRVKTLESKGVPDSITASIKVFLYNYQTAKKLGNGNEASKITDSIFQTLANAEKWYQDFISQNKSAIESKISSFQSQKQNLTGLQLRTADSISKIIDSLVKADLLIQANEKIKVAESILPDLLKQEQAARKVKPGLIGKWKDVHVVKAEEGNFKYTETTLYTFKSDGSFEGSEERKGQSTPFMKEDWQFLSWGTYDLKGDTVFLFVSREKCPRQTFTQLNAKENKWVENKKATYDSTISDNSKDKSIPFTYIKDNFKKL